MTYTVIGHPNSRALRVMWMLEEAEQPYDIIPATPQSEEARAATGSGKIPALDVEGVILRDSVAIVQFLADKHGCCTYTAGTLERGQQDGHTQFAVDELDGSLWTAAKHKFALPADWQVPDVKATAAKEFALGLSRLTDRLDQNTWLMGDQFTVADMIAIHCLGWARAAKFDIPDGVVSAYAKRGRSRPAFRRALERTAAFVKSSG